MITILVYSILFIFPLILLHFFKRPILICFEKRIKNLIKKIFSLNFIQVDKNFKELKSKSEELKNKLKDNSSGGQNNSICPTTYVFTKFASAVAHLPISLLIF